jgi:DNA-binding NtrC family response regulator
MPQRLLFVDSSVLLTVTFEDFFRAIGFDVTCASTCSDACALLEKSDFDMVITDFDCNFVNGNTVVSELTRRANPIPVIAHAYDATNISHSPLIKEVVFKPASIFQLLEAIDKSLNLTVN